jgi:hypothetical protein
MEMEFEFESSTMLHELFQAQVVHASHKTSTEDSDSNSDSEQFEVSRWPTGGSSNWTVSSSCASEGAAGDA